MKFAELNSISPYQQNYFTRTQAMQSKSKDFSDAARSSASRLQVRSILAPTTPIDLEGSERAKGKENIYKHNFGFISGG
jgi:hypothetical protein